VTTTDISRSAFDPRKHYAGVRMQQGRVIVDDDWNEGQVIDDETERRTLVDVIGPAGSPDQGFLIDNPTVTGGKLDFDILPGTFYAGGLRLSLETKQTFRTQTDWLQEEAAAPTPPAAERYDLAYLEVWQQSVQAVEDGELLEVALGGPDTSTRVRTMARVGLFPDVGTDECPDAWKDLRDRWAALGLGTVNAQGELVPNVTLTVTYGPGGDSEDLCTPTVAGGYLGAENQAIRVQLVDGTHLTWGFDNASPLYRVRVEADGVTVNLLTEPKDQAHWPLAGQVVEILAWSAVLPNGEKVAERMGHLSSVATSYSPDSGRLTLQTALPATFGQAWQQRPDAAALAQPSKFLFMRVWDRGSDRASAPAIAFTPGTVLALGNTGLLVTIAGSDRRAGDYWIIAARPETPNRVVPWQLEQGRAPNGPRTFVAPLGIIHWTVSGTAVQGVVASDCRDTFDPLTRQRGCCTWTVGDGTHSHGDFSTIQDAVDHLPSVGGEICVLPGLYQEHVLIQGRHDVVITGCGPRSQVGAQDGDVDKGVIVIADSANVTIRSLRVVAPVCTGIRVMQRPGRGEGVVGVTVEDLEIAVRDRAAVYADAGTGIRVVGNTIRVLPLKGEVERDSDVGLWPAVFVAGEGVLVERNDIQVTSLRGLRRTALGGVQIGGGSVDVEIRRNRIQGGLGNGITLGSVVYVPADDGGRLVVDWASVIAIAYKAWPGWGYGIDDQGCLSTPTGDNPTDPAGNPLIPVSEGALSGIRIVDNLVADMGSSGISVARFFSPDEEDVISVDRLSIETNAIRRCLRLGTPQVHPKMLGLVGFGGIALADCQDLLIHDNLIEGNGTGHSDPVCGVFAVRVEGVIVVDNRIVDNGPLVSGEAVFRPGQRGGIVLGLAMVQATRSLGLVEGIRNGPGEAFARSSVGDFQPVDAGGLQAQAVASRISLGAEAAFVHDNVVVAPTGPALWMRAVGAVSVEGNVLVSRGVAGVDLRTAVASSPAMGTVGTSAPVGLFAALGAFLGGAVVTILDLGVSSEIYGRAAGFTSLSTATLTTSRTGVFGVAGLLAGGEILFNDNRVRLEPAIASGRPLCSVLLLSLDDVSMEGNQSTCALQVETITTNSIVGGWSVRVADNRFEENLSATSVSAVTLGMLNSTTDNQSTHCLLVIGHPALTVNQPNRALVDIAGDTRCAVLQRSGDRIGIVLFGSTGPQRIIEEVDLASG
jgi:hypothetical protein